MDAPWDRNQNGSRVEEGPALEATQDAYLYQPTSTSDVSKLEDGKPGEDIPASSNGGHNNTRSKPQHGWRRIVRHFTPSWFVVNMGTGISSILLYDLPYNGRWLLYISYIIFALNVLLFVVFLFINLLRYTLYPKIWPAMINHPAQSLFLGCFPMGFGTIINMMAFVCVPAWGGDWWKVVWAFWWIDVVVAVAACLCMPFIMMDRHAPTLQNMTAAWLLPIVAPIVSAGSGAIVGGILPHDNDKLITLIVSYIIWAMAESLAMIVIVIYFLRLTTKRLVAKEVIVSTFLPLGPCGMGGFASQELGNLARTLFRDTNTLPATTVFAGDVLYIVGFLAALALWAFGLIWLFFALATIWRIPKFPFNMGWWGFTFPIGVFAISTTTLAKEIPSAFFRVLGTILSIAEILLWIVVASGTLYRAWTGEMFFAPCLKDLNDEKPANGKKAQMSKELDAQKTL